MSFSNNVLDRLSMPSVVGEISGSKMSPLPVIIFHYTELTTYILKETEKAEKEGMTSPRRKVSGCWWIIIYWIVEEDLTSPPPTPRRKLFGITSPPTHPLSPKSPYYGRPGTREGCTSRLNFSEFLTPNILDHSPQTLCWRGGSKD